MVNPAISVVMPVYNSERFLTASIGSILGQQFTDFELVIVDDGSTDRSGTLIRRFAGSDRRIVVLSQDNQGTLAARNKGLAAARGRYVAIMDSDDIAHTNRLSETFRYLEENDHVVCVGSGILYIDGNGKSLGKKWQPPAICRSDFSLMPPRVAQLPHCTAMIRKDAFQALGGYRPFFQVAHDLDLYLRLEELGEIHCLNGKLAAYRVHQSNLSTNNTLIQERNAVFAMLSAISRRAGLEDPIGSRPDAEIDFFTFKEVCYGIADIDAYCELVDLRVLQRRVTLPSSINMFRWFRLWSKFYLSERNRNKSIARLVQSELAEIRPW